MSANPSEKACKPGRHVLLSLLHSLHPVLTIYETDAAEDLWLYVAVWRRQEFTI